MQFLVYLKKKFNKKNGYKKGKDREYQIWVHFLARCLGETANNKGCPY